MAQTTLINTTEVLSKAPVDHNMDPNRIGGFIYHAEDRWIRQWLGDTWYESMVTTAAGDASNNLTSHELTFWNQYLHEICSYAVMYEVIDFLATKITSQGVMQNFTESSASASTAATKNLKASMKTRMEAQMKLADEWLRDSDRSANYPNYRGNDLDNCDNTASMVKGPGVGFILLDR